MLQPCCSAPRPDLRSFTAFRPAPRNSKSSARTAAAGTRTADSGTWSAVSTAPLSAPAQAPSGCLVRSRVIKPAVASGRLFRIRHMRDDDLYAVAQLQASAFHEAPPLKALDSLAYTIFKAEVLSAVQKKTKVLAADGFAMMVVECCGSNGGGTNPSTVAWGSPPMAAAVQGDNAAVDVGGHGAASSSGRRQDWDTAVWVGDHQPAAAAAGAWQYHYGTSSSSMFAADSAAGAGSILGVIEVGVQDEADVLQHLPKGIDTYAYISSMAVAPQLRRCGVGAALLQAAEQQAQLWGQPLVALHVYASNEPAIRLYERHGLRQEACDPAWKGLVGGKVRQLHVKYL